MAGRKKPGVKGRTDLGVGPDETGAYATRDHYGSDRVVYRLRRITDGMTADFVDDGSSAGTPLNGRQALVNAMRKSFVVYNEAGEAEDLPLFFSDKRLPGQFARVDGFPIPVADKQIKEVMAENIKARDIRRGKSADEWTGQKVAAHAEEIRTKDAARAAMGSK